MSGAYICVEFQAILTSVIKGAKYCKQPSIVAQDEPFRVALGLFDANIAYCALKRDGKSTAPQNALHVGLPTNLHSIFRPRHAKVP